MDRKLYKLLLFFIIFTLTINGFGLFQLTVHAESCQKMEEKSLLLYQKFRKGKACKDKEIGEGWKECLFKVGETEILLINALRRINTEKMQGFHGSGFKVLSIGPDVRVRIFTGDDFGLIVRVQGKNNLEENGCIYNEAYITLDSDVLSPGELNNVMYGPIPQSENFKEQIKYIQRNLAILGHDPKLIDGIFGPRTRAAFEAYKQEKHIPPDLPDEAIFNLIAIDAFFKRSVELEKMDKEMWEPPSLSR